MRRYIWLMKQWRAMGARWYHLVWETVLLVVSKQHRREWYHDTSWHT